ncbi:hypothetical protein FGU65_02355 [Methanoculleus sp. FWC-SCC1]|uniref:PQQ-like domain-containing protein n=1 Tax=Methanoculleus frigidifontis TaxID=2584085 RepID=A0ABT8M737_9EURY|nr:hypothetical protein [Methanoculleus sp. FWC-SCC1]MDN7023747.1 hypothetical protein [Methanoculleus sp. FWC-SCC1]
MRSTAGTVVGTGFLAGVAFLAVVEALSRTWNGAFVYNQNLSGIGITQTYVSLMLVILVAGFFASYCTRTEGRDTQILSAALAGAVAMITARTLLFIPDPAYLIGSLCRMWFRDLLFVIGAALIAALGGLIGSLLGRDGTEGYRSVLPVMAVAVLVIAAPPLLAAAGIAAGVIPPVPYSGGAPAAETDIRLLKVSAAGDIVWEARIDLDAYDRPDVLAEHHGGYALAVTEPGQEENTVHIVVLDENGSIRRQSAVETGFGRVTALVPMPDEGYLMAVETPEIVRIDTGGAVLWRRSLADESQGMTPVSLIALADDRYVAVWGDTTACYSDNGTRIWKTSLATAGGIGYHPVYPASEGGVLVVTEAKGVFAGDHFETYLQAVRLDANGTVLWKRDFGSEGLDELLGVWETAPGRFGVLYRSTTFPEDLMGSVVPAHQGYAFSLDSHGDVTGSRAVGDDGGVVVPSSGGYLSIVTGDAGITLTGHDVTGTGVWRQERAIDLNRHAIRGIGTADGGYLVAGSVAA